MNVGICDIVDQSVFKPIKAGILNPNGRSPGGRQGEEDQGR